MKTNYASVNMAVKMTSVHSVHVAFVGLRDSISGQPRGALYIYAKGKASSCATSQIESIRILYHLRGNFLLLTIAKPKCLADI